MMKIRFNLFSGVLLLLLSSYHSTASAIEFETDMVDSSDSKNIDFSRFSTAGYVMPGHYPLTITLNGRAISEHKINVYAHPQKGGKESISDVCLTPDIISLFDLQDKEKEKLKIWHNGECISMALLSASHVQVDLAKSELAVTLPQAFLKYNDPSWDPPSRWNNGVAGGFIDYNLTTTVTQPAQQYMESDTTIFGTVGANAGAWRLRGDYQAEHSNSSSGTQQEFDWTRIYAFRPLPDLQAKMTLGENYLDTEIFDAWRYTGISISSDESMLSPNQRGYAPEITGIAQTNAKVIVSQQGQVIYQTTVPPGPFRVQDLNTVIAGKLNVRIEEQNGEVRHFDLDASAVPYLTRPGRLRYKIAAGRPASADHHIQGPVFAMSEFSWGLSNVWTLYGGSTLASLYQALAVGVGRDLFGFGAFSADVTQARARLPGGQLEQGKSWRFNYSKFFNSFNGGITFAGYRFSERNFLTMEQFLDQRHGTHMLSGRNKSLYNIMINKSFSDANLSLYLSYTYQDFWDRPSSQNYSLTLSRFFDLFGFKNISLSLSATRTQLLQKNDDALFVSFSVPLGEGYLSYDIQNNNSHQMTQNTSYYKRLDNHNAMRLSVGGSSQGTHSRNINAYYDHSNDWTDMALTASWMQGSYRSAGMTLQGGFTATAHGAALHPGYGSGSTRLMVDTAPASNVPVNDGEVSTNLWGIGVLTNQNNYYRTHTSVDINNLPAGVEVVRPVEDTTLTEGAIGYQRFKVLKGWKGMVKITQQNNMPPPFGASVQNSDGRELGIVGDDGQAWLAGIQTKSQLSVSWGGETQCQIRTPANLASSADTLPLRCLSQHSS